MASDFAELICDLTPVAPLRMHGCRNFNLSFSIRIVLVDILCNDWKSAEFKLESIVNLPFSVKDK
ncbi:hypothetical protein DSCOOX_24060 [Desulfosarcina ovata subsp. ovata]|uniref:Uncharacterized protein n=1 Tax=Desulfosarcina ovata subsp. ovata TaxID=2752305 RepID=A0A5K8A9Q2_9BACT|nr:hypothetical protein DSCOOX_24060 [Desulfosarcina ovata subsp. ovata]